MLCELTTPFKGLETERRELLQRSNMKGIVPVKGVLFVLEKSMIFYKWGASLIFVFIFYLPGDSISP